MDGWMILCVLMLDCDDDELGREGGEGGGAGG